MSGSPRRPREPAELVLPAAEFKASALAVMREVRDTGKPVTVTNHGRPLVHIVPVRGEAEPTGAGCMKSTCELLASESNAFPWRAAPRARPADPGGTGEP